MNVIHFGKPRVEVAPVRIDAWAWANVYTEGIPVTCDPEMSDETLNDRLGKAFSAYYVHTTSFGGHDCGTKVRDIALPNGGRCFKVKQFDRQGNFRIRYAFLWAHSSGGRVHRIEFKGSKRLSPTSALMVIERYCGIGD